MIIPVILSGGSGTRLWPLSRKAYPKQLLNLSGGQYTMLQETLKRVGHLRDPIIVCNEDHRFMVAQQCQDIDVKPSSIILETVGRNTAPAIALSAINAMEQDPEAVIAVFPADHIIEDVKAFSESLELAAKAAQDGALVTFGIVANKPETGYGYIKAQAGNTDEIQALPVERFVEKPDLETAREYIESGQYYWNSGMFVFKAKVYMEVLAKENPEIIECCKNAYDKASTDLDFLRVDKASFEPCPDDSIDYAVMERSSNVVVVPMNAGWSDIGSWSSLWDISQKTEQGNVHFGDVVSIESKNNLIRCNDKLVSTIGVSDLVIVDTKDALLVAKKDQVQKVKDVVGELKKLNRYEHEQHVKVHRPWGAYDSIDIGERYQVKRITVNQGASLSLQMHHHRAEHWIIVSGTALVQVGDKETLLTENESIYIPIGEKHRLTNPGKLPLELIEVQSGGYLGEDDIVRFEDSFGRC